jgi:hypothetical protein
LRSPRSRRHLLLLGGLVLLVPLLCPAAAAAAWATAVGCRAVAVCIKARALPAGTAGALLLLLLMLLLACCAIGWPAERWELQEHRQHHTQAGGA